MHLSSPRHRYCFLIVELHIVYSLLEVNMVRIRREARTGLELKHDSLVAFALAGFFFKGFVFTTLGFEVDAGILGGRPLPRLGLC
jgi:hypothetical protein